MGPWSVRTDVFEGPLDLLLYLVRREGLDVRTVPMAVVANAYLDTLTRMRALNLSVAADYLVMAATLTHLKSLELLPRLPTALEDEEDPREALTRQLVEYERFKRAADDLDGHVVQGRDVFVRAPGKLPSAARPVYSPVDAFGLLDLFYGLLLRKDAAVPPVLEIGDSGADVSTCCQRVLTLLGGRGGQAELGDILLGLTGPAERVVTFIGVLEMARLQWVTVTQHVHLGPVMVVAQVDPDVDLSRVTGEVAREAV